MATAYERKRLENIRRNGEMMAALNVHAKASLLSAATAAKRPRRDESKSFNKQKKTEPIVIRQSQRTRGFTPDSAGLPYQSSHCPKPRRKSLAPVPFDVAYEGENSHTQFVDSLLSCNVVVNREDPDSVEFGLESLSLEPHNVARVVPGKILVAKFLPCENVKMVAAGDVRGSVGFWNLDSENEEDDGIYLFSPHTASVSSLVFQQNSFSRVISSSFDGFIRLMDIDKLVFDLVYSTDEAIYSLSQRPNDEQSLYFSEGTGMFKIWDLRAGKSFFQWDLHNYRIETIDFNPLNPHVMATSSLDRTACLWDLRSIGANKPKTLRTVKHSRAVHSAYFSPSGLSLATTSRDNYVGILSGPNLESTSMIYHNNQTERWISNFRGVWGWDDSHIFIGNLSKKIDVISTELKRTVMALQNPLMKDIPCKIHCHPHNVGMLAGSTAEGQVYVWTTM
ncbi:Protein DAMAGED DNA-BINDING 2 [Cardamine amara subsp. amara]|uniref:WD repeat-containing protein 76 n=1 Tax=Cardamine amara subsp. amara TaxID=228776 RepID=A0ABD0ZVN0_CARAN